MPTPEQLIQKFEGRADGYPIGALCQLVIPEPDSSIDQSIDLPLVEIISSAKDIRVRSRNPMNGCTAPQPNVKYGQLVELVWRPGWMVHSRAGQVTFAQIQRLRLVDGST